MLKCPAQETLGMLGQKWSLSILRVIQQNKVKRFNELYRELKGISPRTLSKRLEELESEDIISKRIYHEIPLRVEYSLTKKGIELIACFEHIDKWVVNWKK